GAGAMGSSPQTMKSCQPGEFRYAVARDLADERDAARFARTSASALRELRDLAEADRAHVLPGPLRLVPCDDAQKRLVQVPGRPPSQLALGGARVQRQMTRLGGVLSFVQLPGERALPQHPPPLDN